MNIHTAAAAAVVVAAGLAVIDATTSGGIKWFEHHVWATQILSSGVVLFGTYILIERAVARRERTRWLYVAEGPVLRFAAFTRRVLADALKHWPGEGVDAWLSVTADDMKRSLKLIDEGRELGATAKVVLASSSALACLLPAMADVEVAIDMHEARIRRALLAGTNGDAPEGSAGDIDVVDGTYGLSHGIFRSYQEFVATVKTVHNYPFLTDVYQERDFETLGRARRVKWYGRA